MPRIKAKAAQGAGADLVKAIRKAAIEMGLPTIHSIAVFCDMEERTLSRRFQEPGQFKLKELLVIGERLKMKPEGWEPITRGGAVK